MTSENAVRTLDLSRRGFLRRAALVAGAGALAGGAVVGPAAAQSSKVTQAMAKYQPTPKNGQRCSGCSQFQAPAACKIVAGKVSPAGWCLLWAAKPS